MNYVIDIALIVLLVLVVSASVKKGFLTSLLESLSLAISATLSYFLTPTVSEFIYQKFVYNSVKTKLSETLSKVTSGESLGDKVAELVGNIPASATRLAEAFGVNINSLADSVTNSSVGTDEALINTVTDKIAYNILIVAIEALVFLVLFILLAVIIKLLAKLIGKAANKLRLVGPLNRLLGGALGLIKAALLILVICTVLFFIAGASDNSTVVSTIEASKIYGLISANNPIINFLS